MISLEKLKILTPLQELPKNVGDLGKIIVASGFKKLLKVQKISQSGHIAQCLEGVGCDIGGDGVQDMCLFQCRLPPLDGYVAVCLVLTMDVYASVNLSLRCVELKLFFVQFFEKSHLEKSISLGSPLTFTSHQASLSKIQINYDAKLMQDQCQANLPQLKHATEEGLRMYSLLILSAYLSLFACLVYKSYQPPSFIKQAFVLFKEPGIYKTSLCRLYMFT